jgi:hypothetical protein
LTVASEEDVLATLLRQLSLEDGAIDLIILRAQSKVSYGREMMST